MKPEAMEVFSSVSDYSLLGARPKHDITNSTADWSDPSDLSATLNEPMRDKQPVKLLDRLSPMVHLNVRSSKADCGSDAGYHSLAPTVNDGGYHSAHSRSPTTSCSTSSLETSSLGRPVSHSNVWNIRATTGYFSPKVSSRQRKIPHGRSVTPNGLKQRNRRCHFERLSDDLMIAILSFLSSVDIVRISKTCKRLYFLSWEPELWTCLTINNPEIETDRAIKSILEVINRNSGLAALRTINLAGSGRLTDRGLAILARRCPALTQLDLHHCHGVTNGGLLDLVSRCTQLNHLDVTGIPTGAKFRFEKEHITFVFFRKIVN